MVPYTVKSSITITGIGDQLTPQKWGAQVLTWMGANWIVVCRWTSHLNPNPKKHVFSSLRFLWHVYVYIGHLLSYQLTQDNKK